MAAQQQIGLTQHRNHDGVVDDAGGDVDGGVDAGGGGVGGRAAAAMETTRMNAARVMPLRSWRACHVTCAA
jgi:hypothetical protein